VLFEGASGITSEKIVAFAESVASGVAQEYKMDEEVTYEAGEAAPEEELWFDRMVIIHNFKSSKAESFIY